MEKISTRTINAINDSEFYVDDTKNPDNEGYQKTAYFIKRFNKKGYLRTQTIHLHGKKVTVQFHGNGYKTQEFSSEKVASDFYNQLLKSKIKITSKRASELLPGSKR